MIQSPEQTQRTFGTHKVPVLPWWQSSRAFLAIISFFSVLLFYSSLNVLLADVLTKLGVNTQAFIPSFMNHLYVAIPLLMVGLLGFGYASYFSYQRSKLTQKPWYERSALFPVVLGLLPVFMLIGYLSYGATPLMGQIIVAVAFFVVALVSVVLAVSFLKNDAIPDKIFTLSLYSDKEGNLYASCEATKPTSHLSDTLEGNALHAQSQPTERSSLCSILKMLTSSVLTRTPFSLNPQPKKNEKKYPPTPFDVLFNTFCKTIETLDLKEVSKNNSEQDLKYLNETRAYILGLRSIPISEASDKERVKDAMFRVACALKFALYTENPLLIVQAKRLLGEESSRQSIFGTPNPDIQNALFRSCWLQPLLSISIDKGMDETRDELPYIAICLLGDEPKDIIEIMEQAKISFDQDAVTYATLLGANKVAKAIAIKAGINLPGNGTDKNYSALTQLPLDF